MPDYEFYTSLYTDMGEVYSLLIPKQSEGFYRFSEDPMLSFLQIEAQGGLWYARCNTPALFVDSDSPWSSEVLLEKEGYYTIECDYHTYALHVLPIIREHLVFHNYFTAMDAVIRIGGNPECEIVYTGPYCAPIHALLQRVDGNWYINCKENRYGTYVNGKRVTEQIQLYLGDIIQISGMRMIIGTDFLSISSRPDCLSISSTMMREPSGGGFSRYSGQSSTTDSHEFFNRTARRPVTLPQRTIAIEGPPMSMARAQMPLMLRMGSSLVMGGTSALTGNYSMLISSVLFPLLNSKYSDEQKRKYDQLREVRYREYLELKRKEICEACKEEKELLDQKYPSLSQVLRRAADKERLWDHRPMDEDFLSLRVGNSEKELSAVIDYPQQSFHLEPDELEDEMYRLATKQYMLEDTPATLSLVENRVCGLSGDVEKVREFILHLALQIAALHSYDEVKLVFLCDGKCEDILEHIRYLPHTWDDHKKIRFIATNEVEAFRLGEYLQDQLPDKLELDRELRQILKNRPYYVVFALGQKAFDSIEVLKQVMQADEHHGISVIAAYGQPPKECSKIIQLKKNEYSKIISLTGNSPQDVRFTCDYCPQEVMDMAKQTISNTRLRSADQAEALPKMVAFLDMFHAGRIEHLNPLKRWRENNPVVSLSVPVGVGTDGLPFSLDLHEKRQGPHGLVAGMTGSGKSEFLITYILSLAVNFHPHEVAFVLIDYKGGGLAGAFENATTGVRLPHLIGTITNLDGNAVRRSIISLESEVRRRQEEFNIVKSIVNEGTMDIYEYQKLYRAGKLRKPMPHLFIIADEFAELKQQRPEFIEQLISIARIGRSLGIHLILATQKPSGVVNDQIRSNTKFRACLRVQDRADSMDMLKRPEAAELTDTGRFYLQVGYNEYFAMAQSAWCGAPYEPQEVIRQRKDDGIEFVDHTGQRIAKAKPRVMRKKTGVKQLVAVVKYLSDLANSEGILHDPLWEKELPKKIDITELYQDDCNAADGEMSIPIALIDDPENQRQLPLRIDFETCKNIMITGLSGSGKTTVIENILWQLTERLSPQDLNYYVMDYSSRMLKNFESLPHCGTVLLEEDDNRLDDFFDVIHKIIDERKKLFSELEVDNFQAARTLRRIPLVLVVIDNIVGLSSSKRGEAYQFALPGYLKNSAAYGVKFIISCSRMNEMTSKIRMELAERICLNLKEKYDYTDILGCKANYQPPDLPGRGLCKYEDRALEYQAAMIYSELDTKERIRKLKSWVREIIRKHGAKMEAKSLAVNDIQSEFAPFADQFEKGRFPLGISKDTAKAVALPLRQFSLLSLYFGSTNASAPVMQNMLYNAARERMEVWIVKRRSGSLFDSGKVRTDGVMEVDFCTAEPESLSQLVTALSNVKMNQEKAFQDYCAEKAIGSEDSEAGMRAHPEMLERIKPLFVLIESAEDFFGAMDTLLQLRVQAVFLKCKKLHLYIAACFEPDFPRKLTESSLYNCFRSDNILLFGGNSGRQSLVNISSSTEEKNVAFNDAQMFYRGRLYGLTMPCGLIEVTESAQEKDLESIF